MRKLPALIARSHLTIKKRLALTLSPRPQHFPQHLSSADCVRRFRWEPRTPPLATRRGPCRRFHFAEEQTEAQRGKITCPKHTAWAWRSRQGRAGCWRNPAAWALHLACPLLGAPPTSRIWPNPPASRPRWAPPKPHGNSPFLRIPRACSPSCEFIHAPTYGWGASCVPGSVLGAGRGLRASQKRGSAHIGPHAEKGDR